MVFAEMGMGLLALLRSIASNMVVAVVLLLIGIVVSRLIERLAYTVLHELEFDNWLKKAGVRFALEQTVSSAIKYFGYFITVLIALNQIGLTSFVVNLAAMGIIVLVLVAIVLGVKDFVPNFLAGLRIHQRGFVKEGDIIRVRDIEGEVREINLLDTRIRTQSGDVLFIPNAMLTKHEVLRHKRKKTMLK